MVGFSPPHLGWFDLTLAWGFLIQTLMGAIIVVVIKKLTNDPAGMSLVEDDHVVEDTKEDFYRALRRAQATVDVDESQLSEWLEYFIRALRKQKQALERKIETENLMAPLALLSEKLLTLAREHGRITVKKAAGATGVS